MFAVGLTGGIGSGKSTVADCFAALGVPVIDTDVIARDLTAPGGAALEEIRAVFGETVMQADGTLDRAALRRRVFADGVARRQLEAILHPRIRRLVEQTLATLTAPYALIVIPLLVQRQDHPQGAGRGCKADKSATTTHRPKGEHPEGHKCLAAYSLRVQHKAEFHPASISAACCRVVAVILRPPSMRAISSTRATASSSSMLDET